MRSRNLTHVFIFFLLKIRYVFPPAIQSVNVCSAMTILFCGEFFFWTYMGRLFCLSRRIRIEYWIFIKIYKSSTYRLLVNSQRIDIFFFIISFLRELVFLIRDGLDLISLKFFFNFARRKVLLQICLSSIWFQIIFSSESHDFCETFP